MAASLLPAHNPRLYGKELPLEIGVVLPEDGLRITIEGAANLSSCQMLVGLQAGPNVTWAKRIRAWNSAIAQDVDAVETRDANRGPNVMLIEKASGSRGADEIHLEKFAWSRWMDMYTFDPTELWASWGGLKVTFNWFADGARNPVPLPPPAPVYPQVDYPDGSLLATTPPPIIAAALEPTRSRVARWLRLGPADTLVRGPVVVAYLVVGGAKFPIRNSIEDEYFLSLVGRTLAGTAIVPQRALDRLPTAPVDFTLLKGFPEDGTAYITYGRAKFEYQRASSLVWPVKVGLPTSRLPNLLPAPALAAIPNVPRDGTLLKEETTATIYLVRGGTLWPISNMTRFDQLCLASTNVRIVPDGTTNTLPRSTTPL